MQSRPGRRLALNISIDIEQIPVSALDYMAVSNCTVDMDET